MNLIETIYLISFLSNLVLIYLVLSLNRRLNEYIDTQESARQTEEAFKNRENDYRSILLSRLDEVQNARFSSLHKTRGK